MYIYRSACLYCRTIQPVENILENIGVLHDENHIVLRTKLNIISLPERNMQAILT
jgi:hypothetical protein